MSCPVTDPERGAATSRWDVAQRPTEPAGETKASASQKTPPPKSGVRVMSRVATRQALGEKKLKFFPYPIPYEKGERPYAIPDLSGG